MRPPVVAGVGGGVATTTLAVALRGHDAGCGFPGSADIVACRGTLDSVRRAATVLEQAGPGPLPVLAVTLDGVRARGPLRARLALLEGQAAAVVLLPHVGRWRLLADPYAEVAGLLVQPPAHLPRPLRPYVAALRELAAAVAASGRLDAPPARPGARVPRLDRPSAPFRQAGGFASPPEPSATALPDGSRRMRGRSELPGASVGPPPAAPPGGAPPRIVGTFRPVVGTAPVRPRGVRIVPPVPGPVPARSTAPPGRGDVGPERPPLAGVPDRPAERVEQVG